MRKWVSLGVGVIISVVIFILLIGSDLDVLREELAQAHYIYLLPGAGLFIIGIGTRAVRWRLLLKNQISFKDSFHIINIGYFLSGILPLRLGDVARAWLTTRLERPVSGFTGLSTILIERLLDLLAVLALLGFSLFLLDVPREVSSVGAVMAVMALGSGLVIAFFAAKPHLAHQILIYAENALPFIKRLHLKTPLTQLLEGIQPMSQPRAALNILTWTGISWGFSVAAAYVYLYTVFDSPTLGATLAYVVLGSFSVALPAVPGNLGPFEGAVVGGLWIGGLISSASAPANAPALAFAAILHGVTLAIYISLGLIGLYAQHASIRQISQGSHDLIQPQPSTHELVDENERPVAMSKPRAEIAPEQAS